MHSGSQSDERQLIEAAAKGDTKAFRALVERHQQRALAVALGMVHDRDEASDICQEAFLKAYRHLAMFEGEARFFTWLYRIIMNLCIDHIRKQRGEKTEFDENMQTEVEDDSGIAPVRLGLDPVRALLDRELHQQLEQALEALPALHRAVLLMREVEGLSYQEMAEALDCSIGTVMSRLFHARKKMQALLHEVRRESRGVV